MTAYRAMACPFCGHRSFNVEQSVEDRTDLRVCCADCGMDHPGVAAVTAEQAAELGVVRDGD